MKGWNSSFETRRLLRACDRTCSKHSRTRTISWCSRRRHAVATAGPDSESCPRDDIPGLTPVNGTKADNSPCSARIPVGWPFLMSVRPCTGHINRQTTRNLGILAHRLPTHCSTLDLPMHIEIILIRDRTFAPEHEAGVNAARLIITEKWRAAQCRSNGALGSRGRWQPKDTGDVAASPSHSHVHCCRSSLQPVRRPSRPIPKRDCTEDSPVSGRLAIINRYAIRTLCPMGVDVRCANAVTEPDWNHHESLRSTRYPSAVWAGRRFVYRRDGSR